MTMDTKKASFLLNRCAVRLQDYCAEVNGTLNDSLASEVNRFLQSSEGQSRVNYERRDEVLRVLCEVSARVGAYFNNQYAADCICPDAQNSPCFEDQILNFIRDAVQEKMLRDGKPRSRYEED